MSTDRELLELAAKAAGWTGWQSKHGYWNLTSPEGESQTRCNYWVPYDPYTGEKLPAPAFADAIVETGWNPLTDDGDALRLMARLNINVSYRENINGAWVVAEHEGIEFCPESLDGPHEDDATRRAIVRAAAEIAKATKDHP